MLPVLESTNQNSSVPMFPRQFRQVNKRKKPVMGKNLKIAAKKYILIFSAFAYPFYILQNNLY